MSLSNLRGIPKSPPYADADVERVKSLLNSAAVTVGEVSQYFKVPRSVVISNLAGVPVDGEYSQEEANKVEKLISAGVASISDIAQNFKVAPSVIEDALVNGFNYNSAQIAEAQAGLPVSRVQTQAPDPVAPDPVAPAAATPATAPAADTPVAPAPAVPTNINDIPVDGDYTQQEVALVVGALNNKYVSAADVAKRFGFTEQQVNEELQRQNEVLNTNLTEQLKAALSATPISPTPISATPTGGGATIPSDITFGGNAQDFATGAATGPTQVIAAPAAAPVTPTPTAAPAATPATAPAAPLAGRVTASSGIQNTTDPNAVAAKDSLPSVASANYATGSDIPIGLKGSEQALKGATAGSIDMFDAVNRAARQDINPYAIAGQDALRTQRALAGLDGQAAFDAAYQQSPQMAFLREQGERAALRNSAATGGLGGGNVLKELTRYNTGLASQDLQNQIANINQLSGRGFNAATQMANLNLNTGLPAAQSLNTLGINLATGRTNAASELSDQYGNAATKLANILGSQGSNISNLVGTTSSNIINARNNAAINEARAQENFGTNLSNIQTGMGNQLAGVPMAPIVTPNYAAGVANAANSAALGAEIFGGDGTPAPVGTSKPTYTNPNYGWGDFLELANRYGQ